MCAGEFQFATFKRIIRFPPKCHYGKIKMDLFCGAFWASFKRNCIRRRWWCGFPQQRWKCWKVNILFVVKIYFFIFHPPRHANRRFSSSFSALFRLIFYVQNSTSWRLENLNCAIYFPLALINWLNKKNLEIFLQFNAKLSAELAIWRRNSNWLERKNFQDIVENLENGFKWANYDEVLSLQYWIVSSSVKKIHKNFLANFSSFVKSFDEFLNLQQCRCNELQLPAGVRNGVIGIASVGI